MAKSACLLVLLGYPLRNASQIGCTLRNASMFSVLICRQYPEKSGLPAGSELFGSPLASTMVTDAVQGSTHATGAKSAVEVHGHYSLSFSLTRSCLPLDP